MTKSALYIALPAEEGAPLQFAQETGDCIEVVTHPESTKPEKVVAFAPSTAVGHFRLAVPSRSDAEAARAALYAIEDELAQPVEEVHVVLGLKSASSTERDIYVVDRSLMTGWLDLMSKMGLSPDQIVPEQCLFTDVQDPVDLGDRIILKEGNRVIGIDASMPSQAREALGLSSTNANIAQGDHLVRLAERNASRRPVNLRTGLFAPKKGKRESVSAWRKVAGIAIAAVSIWTGTLILEARNYSYAARQLNQSSLERFSSLFPVAPVPTDLERTTRDMLAVSGTTPDKLEFRPAVAALYEAVALHPGTHLSSLTFQQEQNRLTATIHSASADTASNVATFIESRGFQSIAAEATQNNAGFTAEITLEAVP